MNSQEDQLAARARSRHDRRRSRKAERGDDPAIEVFHGTAGLAAYTNAPPLDGELLDRVVEADMAEAAKEQASGSHT